MYIGIDCGTQGTKVIVYDPAQKKVLGEGYSPHEIITSEQGKREQKPVWWISAFTAALSEALKFYGGDRNKIRGIGVSGQQHGLVVLDKNGTVIRDAKLWNDTETAFENFELLEKAGGEAEVIKKIGTNIPVGYTASKLVWMKKNEKDLFLKISTVFNPKDYINYYLTGFKCTDFGSASGTGYFNVRDHSWNYELIELIDESGVLKKALPQLVGNDKRIGLLLPEIAREFGLSKSVFVAPGSGDNMMAAIGTGNIKNGMATLTLGTSGVLSIFTNHNTGQYDPITQIQCSATNGWIPTIMTMNATSTTTAFQKLFSLNLNEFNSFLNQSPPGAEGVQMLPFFNGERMPPLPDSKGYIGGLSIQNITKENLIRAGAESVIYGLRWGKELLCRDDAPLTQIRINGGGSNSAPWLQLTADILDTEIIGVSSKEAGALGAAIQAMFIDGVDNIVTLCKDHIVLDKKKHALPVKKNVAVYDQEYKKYLSMRKRIFSY